jgi:hypothetical protein
VLGPLFRGTSAPLWFSETTCPAISSVLSACELLSRRRLSNEPDGAHRPYHQYRIFWFPRGRDVYCKANLACGTFYRSEQTLVASQELRFYQGRLGASPDRRHEGMVLLRLGMEAADFLVVAAGTI